MALLEVVHVVHGRLAGGGGGVGGSGSRSGSSSCLPRRAAGGEGPRERRRGPAPRAQGDGRRVAQHAGGGRGRGRLAPGRPPGVGGGLRRAGPSRVWRSSGTQHARAHARGTWSVGLRLSTSAMRAMRDMPRASAIRRSRRCDTGRSRAGTPCPSADARCPAGSALSPAAAGHGPAGQCGSRPSEAISCAPATAGAIIRAAVAHPPLLSTHRHPLVAVVAPITEVGRTEAEPHGHRAAVAALKVEELVLVDSARLPAAIPAA